MTLLEFCRRRWLAPRAGVEEGQGLVEYGLIIGLVSVLMIAALGVFTSALGGALYQGIYLNLMAVVKNLA